MSWHFMDPASRGNLIGAWTREAEGMFNLAAEPERWEAPTGAGHWQVRDVVGHLVDTTEAYFTSFDAARGGAQAAAPLGVLDMARDLDDGALAFRGTAQSELLERGRKNAHRMMDMIAGLTDEEWAGLMVPHKFMGPLPACFFPLFQLVDYALHSWDIREGTDRAHGLDGDSADLLTPLAFILWQSTPQVPAGTEPYTIGIRVSGNNGGDFLVSVGPEGVGVEPGDLDSVASIIEFDPATLILTAFGRMNGGTVRGDEQQAAQFLNSFFRI